MFTVSAQEQPKPQKDTVNMDTDAKPQFYYAVEDEDSTPGGQGKFASGTIAIVVGAVILLGGAAYLFLRKKK
jgi:LPXTG-motif cell wall-anchored protein